MLGNVPGDGITYLRKEIQFAKPYQIVKSEKYETNLVPKIGRWRRAWQLARSSWSVAR